MDPVTTILLSSGGILLVASWIQLIITASGEDFTWGLCSLFLPPLAYFYALWEWDKAGDAIKMAIGGLALIGLGLS
ncbi:MAG: hypothetical protein P8J42_04670 [Pseudomonadales bacterium]|jgi:hypothetical protein|nr:hypothetical protein [Pseudomonadales bacterium]MDG1938394.1 hypothetical protein [Pseudomonadales bacterium]MDG2035892.1 hypothetical protein [Pseudomonadales bacterium]